MLAAGILLRLVHLDADPDYYAWVGYLTDEGRWVAHAREMALFGHLVNTEWLLHLLIAPLFEAAASWPSPCWGSSFWSSRLLTALSGSLTSCSSGGVCAACSPRAPCSSRSRSSPSRWICSC